MLFCYNWFVNARVLSLMKIWQNFNQNTHSISAYVRSIKRKKGILFASIKSPRYHKNKPFPFQFQSSLNLYTQMAFRALKKSFLLYKANCEVKLKCHTLNELFTTSIVKFFAKCKKEHLTVNNRTIRNNNGYGCGD